MDSLDLNDDFCRICLNQDVYMDWNEELTKLDGITYKYCYYKYTHLQMLDTEHYSHMLCQICSSALETTHLLIDKALESYGILQRTLLSDSQMSCDENGQHEAFTEQKFEPKCKINEFEVLLFEDNDDDLKKECNVDNSDTILEIEIPSNETQEKRKRRVCEKTKFEVDSPKLSFAQEDTTGTINAKQVAMDDIECKYLEKNKQKKLLNNKKKKTVGYKEDSWVIDPSKKIEISEKNPKKKSKKTYMCSCCSKLCFDKRALELHEERHNEVRERSETCPYCGMKLFSKAYLDDHIKIHKEGREKNYKCEFCEKAYFNRGALNVHRRIHLGLMKPCPICSKEFYRQLDLDRHQLVAHSGTSIKAEIKLRKKYYVHCNECDKSMLTTSWKAHQATHLKDPLMKCSICDKEFYSRENCTNHLKKVHNYKTRDEYEPFIIYFKTKRLSHLLLKQCDIIKPVTQ